MVNGLLSCQKIVSLGLLMADSLGISKHIRYV